VAKFITITKVRNPTISRRKQESIEGLARSQRRVAARLGIAVPEIA